MSRDRPINTVLVANRGEIACRILRTARGLGLRTVAVYTDADAAAPHVALADQALRIGAGPVADSYLSIQKILDAAVTSGADAIHPGYGFLSENADFAEAVADAGLTFVGPSVSAIRAMGNKAEAKRIMAAAGVPCVPGYHGVDQSDATLSAEAEAIGYPVMVKAAAGGGGRGVRLVRSAPELPRALALARSEASGAFGSDELILEKAIDRPRHVEVQVFADQHGTCLHLGERDCSVQRRHQKVIEEAPCPVVTEELRARMGEASVAAARRIGYVGAGTVEFLLDEAGAFYFLEMNTRLQVEHPVTEMVTGLDLVALQFTVAAGEPLLLKQEDVHLTGHAIEARLYAEDPANRFLPAAGRIAIWRPAEGPGLRIDAGICEGQTISAHYDPMLAKVIAWGGNREVARRRLIRGLMDSGLIGPRNNVSFLAQVLSSKEFSTENATTALLAELFPEGVPAATTGLVHIALAAACLLQHDQRAAFAAAGYVSARLLGWSSASALAIPLDLDVDGALWPVTAQCKGTSWLIQVEGSTVVVEALELSDGCLRAVVDGVRLHEFGALCDRDCIVLSVGGTRVEAVRRRAGSEQAQTSGGQITAPLPGLVADLAVQPGQSVAAGQVLVVLEAMKMQHQIAAPVAGVVAAVAVSPGAQVSAGDLLVEIEELTSKEG